ncbi:MAG: UDP-N-acetylmuramoyl-L-alanyl-D-glutamate--2,6-diaminopimelate ligase [Desulfobulbaceae bacterium]
MSTLQKLIDALDDADLVGERIPGNGPVADLTADSRRVRQGSVYVALRGERLDGHHYLGEAAAKGCRAVVVERDAAVPGDIPAVRVADTRRAYGKMAAALFDYPARRMTMIGLTGTNGKTTTSWLVEEVLRAAGRRPGVIGTVNYRYWDASSVPIVRDAPLTTPEPVMLHGLLREMCDAGVTDVIMEVSSHALVQQRMAGLVFDAAVFTNLSRDHLDYHHTMEEYFAAKQILFLDHLKENGLGVIVVDNDGAAGPGERAGWGRRLATVLTERGFAPSGAGRRARALITCGMHEGCTVRAAGLKQGIDGLDCTLLLGDGRLPLHSPLIGFHNLLNMMTAAGVGLGLGIDTAAIVRGLERVRGVPGRLERVRLPAPGGAGNGPAIFVDYAHTPDALINVLQTLRPVTAGLLICVFGCGGDRDRGKRPMMGEAAAKLADRVLITSDNPRTEEPAAIIREIEAGVRRLGCTLSDIPGLFDRKAGESRYAVVEDRRQAIHTACARASRDDVVLIAGKGHETYQISAAGRLFFDDRLEAGNGRLRWTMEHLLAATSGRLEQPGPVGLLGEISTDTRTIRPGDVFLALRGENFDGHDFVQAALEKGAGAVIVSEPVRAGSPGAAVVRVSDTLRALGDLAHYRRRALAPDVQVIGITGSSGKTTVKEMTAAIFQQLFAGSGGEPVLKTGGNLNNLVGLPLSLLQLRCGHRTAVMEMGMNRPGEIARLTSIAEPDIGCITNVQTAHLEGLGSIDGVARAKGELFGAMSDRGVRVINCDDPHIRPFGGKNGNNVIGFAVTPDGRRYHPQVRATRIHGLGEAGMRFTLHIGEWRRRITVPAAGAHNVANCAAAAAIAVAGGVAPETIVHGLLQYRCGDKRLQISQLPGGLNVLNDSYNANPASMAAALRTVMGFGRDCLRIAALGDMLELGESSEEAHRGIGALAAELGIDYLAVTGDFAGTVAEAARKAGMGKNRIKRCATAGDAARWIAGLIAGEKAGKGDWLLIKGSRGMRMEQVLTSLQRLLTLG